jgi:hypothetical protein
MDYNTEQQMELRKAINTHTYGGRPEVARDIKLGMAEGLAFSKLMKMGEPKTVKAEVATAVTTHPPFSGKGSGAGPWKAFAKEVSDMDDEIIDAMSKADLITVLKDKGVIGE